MNLFLLRSSAVLAMLCLLPRVSALSINQTATFNLHGSTHSNLPAALVASWHFDPFNVPGAKLDSVTFAGIVSVKATVTEVNPFQFPIGDGSFVDLNSYLRISPSDVILLAHTTSPFGQGEIIPATWPPSSHTVSKTVTNSFSENLADPIWLNFFADGTKPLTQDTAFYGWTSWSSASATGASDLSLTFNYTVPEGGGTVVLLAGTIGVVAGLRRRLNRSRRFS